MPRSRGMIAALSVLVLALAAALAGCTGQASTPTPTAGTITVEDAWVRSTDNKTDATMTSMFMTLVNPSGTDIELTSATCDQAGKVELHETVEKDGAKVMQKVDAINIPAGSHTHLSSGGDHVMLMDLKSKLPVGSEVTVTLTFSTGQTEAVKAPVKEMTEESAHYHPSGSASASAS